MDCSKAPIFCFLLLCSFCLIAVVRATDHEDSLKATLFMDNLHQSSGAGTFGASQQSVEVETETVCFRGGSYCAEATLFGDQEQAGQHNGVAYLSCGECEQRDSASSSPASKELPEVVMGGSGSVGRCVLTQLASAPLPLMAPSGVDVMGTFSGVCYIKDDHSSCGTPQAANDIMVGVQGVMYRIEDAVVQGAPSTAQEYCAEIKRVRSSSARTSGKAIGKGIGTRRRAAIMQAGTNELYHGPAFVYIGPMTVVSHHHAVKFTKGVFQHTIFLDPPTPADAATLKGLPRLDDDVYKFKFVGEERHTS